MHYPPTFLTPSSQSNILSHPSSSLRHYFTPLLSFFHFFPYLPHFDNPFFISKLLQSYPSISPLPSSLTIFQPSSSFLYLFLQPISYYLRIYKSPFHISLLPSSFLISTHPSFLSSPSARLFPSLILPCLHHSLISFPSPFYSHSSSHLPSPPLFPYSFYPPVFITPSFYSHLHSVSTSIPFPPLLHSHLHYIPTSITFQPLLYSHLHYIPSSITFLPPLHSHLHSIPLPRLTSHLPVYFPHSLLSLYLYPPTP